MVDREKLVYRKDEYTYSFKNSRIKNTFGRDICNGKTTLKEIDKNQGSYSVEIINFKKKSKTTKFSKKIREKIYS